MSKILVKFSDECNHDIVCEEFTIFNTPSEFDEWIDSYINHFKHSDVAEIWFGNNKFLRYNSFSEFKRNLEIYKITPDESKVFKKYFTNKSFGTSEVFKID